MDLFGSKLIKKGKELLSLQLYDEALGQFVQAIDKKEDLCNACYYAAVASFEKHEMANAREYLYRVIALKPSNDMRRKIYELTGMKRIVSGKYRNFFPSFSRDGSMLVFASIRNDTNGDGEVNENDNAGIYVVDIESRNERQVVSDEHKNSNPSFSPDGKKILFLSRRRDTNGDGVVNSMDAPGIYMVGVDGGGEKCVVSDQYYNKSASFSPDGRKILFSSWRTDNSGIYLINNDGTGEQQIVTDAYDNTFPSFSRSGQRIVYASWRHDTNKDGRVDIRDNSGIYMIGTDGKGECEVVSYRYNNAFPQFFPDGTRILYLSNRRDTNRDGKIDSLDNNGIYVCDITGRGEKCIVSDKYYNKMPTISYDGEKLVFLSGGSLKEGTMARGFFSPKGIYMVDSNGKNKTQLLGDRYYGSVFLLFSPVENKLVYMSWRKGTNRGIYVMDIDIFPSLDDLKLFVKNLE